jgi:hypothetical protein
VEQPSEIRATRSLSQRAVIKVRAGIVQEIGTAVKVVTGNRKAQVTFIKRFS